MRIKAKSVLICKGKKLDDYEGNDRPVLVSVFEKNDPHLNCQVPKKRYDYETGIHKVILKDLKIDYLLAGHDIVINDLEEVSVENDKKGHLVVSGKQK